MIAILEMQGGVISGWILAQDFSEARRRAHSAEQMNLAEWLYRHEESSYQPGQYSLPTGHILLVQ